MKTTTHKRRPFVLALTVIAAIIALAITVNLSGNAQHAQAEAYNSADNYNFTLVTDEDGNSSYKVAIKPTLRNTVTVAIVPDLYNGLPVTELAAGAFMLCSKLTKVILPESVKTIGNNAFLSCSKLETVLMPNVESLGNAVFSKCSALKNLYIPKSVKSVGKNILQNTTNTVYIQSAAEELGNGWSSEWNDYHTGEVVYSATPESSILYREVYNEANTEIIGYEICEEQSISASEADVVIYNAYRNDESSPYLPVLNICQGAFSGVTLNSLTIKDRPDDDEDFPVFNHKINIRSNAFFLSFIDSINIETDVAFDHPQDLQVGSFENLIGETIVGDVNGHSVGVFEESQMKSITLPASMESIYEKMFYNCTNLKEIKLAGDEYDGTNKLPNVRSIGNCAFSSCGMLENISIPSTVTEMGSSVFFDWGTGKDPDTLENIKQVIDIDFFEGRLPSGWNSGWSNGIYTDNVDIIFNDIIITIDLCDGNNTIRVKSIPGELLPEIDVPTRSGYRFKGVFSEPDGEGVQYYTSSGICTRVWNEDDPILLYANWGEKVYNVGLESNKVIFTEVKARFGEPMPAATMPTKEGYTFCGYYYFEDNGTKTFYYNADMSSARNWDRDEDCTLHADWEATIYYITYNNLGNGINPICNPIKYTIESETIAFFNPYGIRGYGGSWNISEIPSGSVGDKTITAIWTPIEYNITYFDDKNGINPNAAIIKYTIETPTIFFVDPDGVDGYEGEWIPACIPQGSTGNITVEAEWTPVEYEIEYKNLSDDENPNTVYSYNITSPTIEFKKPHDRVGYTVDWDIKEIPHGSTGDKVITAVWTPITYTISYDISYGINPNDSNKTYTIESDTINFAPPYGRDYYIGTWDITSIPKGSTGNKTITAIWTPIQYSITYKLGVTGVTNNNPTKITCEDVVELSYIDRSGYMQVGWKLNDSYVFTLSNIHQDITLVAVWSDGYVVNMDTSITTLIVSVNNMTVKLPSTNYSRYSSLTITAKTNVTTLTISSDYDIVYNMCIDLSSHYSNMNLYLNSVKMMSPDATNSAINMPSHTLNLKTTGACAIYGCDGKNANYPSDYSTSGGVAIRCNEIYITGADNLVIRGGNGGYGYGSGGKGSNGGCAVVASGFVNVYTDNVTLIGGNGGNGMYGAADYGYGAEAVNKEIYNSNYSVTITKGRDGKVV